MKASNWILTYCACWLWSNCFCNGVAGPGTANESDWPSAIGSSFTDCSSDEMTNIYVTYFRHHGVLSVIIVICPEDIATWQQQRDLRSLVSHLGVCGFYVRIFNAGIYADDNQLQANTTHRGNIFTLQKLSHKSGIMLLHLGSNCALNLLAWSGEAQNMFFKTRRFWLLLTQNARHIDLLEDARIFIPPDSETRVMLRFPARGTVTLIDVYKIAPPSPLKRRIIALELQSASALLLNLQYFGSAIAYRYDLEGLTFNTARVIAFPDLYTDIEDISTRHIDVISKVNNRLTLDMADKLNLTFNNYQTDNYGWRQPNGSFDGLMGRFQRYEIDFARNAIFMRLDRVPIVDFVAETYRVRAGLMFRQPPLSSVANIFALPFEINVWIAIVVLMIFTVFVLDVQLRYSPYLRGMSYWDCAMFVCGAMCQQGFYITLFNRSMRITVFTTFVATVFLFTSFSANIVALLRSPSEAIHTLNDLNESPLEIGVQETPYNKIYFNESTDPVTSRLYRKKIEPKSDNVYMRPAVGMERMRTGLFAYQVELQAGYQIISDTFSEPEKCGLKELEPFQLPIIAIPVRKNFAYKELLRRQLRWQREVGLMQREARKWIPQKPKCEGGVSGFVSIGLTECRYALVIYGCGLLLGVLMFLSELIVKRLTNTSIEVERHYLE